MTPRFHELTDEEQTSLAKLKRSIELFRELESRIPSSYIDAFLAVALDPGKGPTAYAKAMNTIQPIASRALLEIGPKARQKEESLGLVDRQVSALSLRDQEYFLTPKGRKLLRDLLNVMEG
jgi:hypothetical protein